VTREIEARLAVDAKARTGEGPFWHQDEGLLYWVDIPSAAVHRFDPAAGASATTTLSQPAGALAPRAAGGLVAAVRDGFAVLERSGQLTMLAEVEADNELTRMNDGGCDSAGRFWAGTMAFDPATHPAAGSLYCLRPDHSVERVLEGVGISNGLDWSPDDRTMYFADTLRYSVDAFDFDAESGAISNRRVFVDLADPGPRFSGPDGLTVDAEGYVWVAVFGKGRVDRYAPDGTLDAVVRLPAANVTSCAFGGPRLDTLFITTASGSLTEEEKRAQPGAGGLFRCNPGAVGRPVRAYGG
jgi:sugar lactone lactonase YvrE